MKINEIWNSKEISVWKDALAKATMETGRDDSIETKMSKLKAEDIQHLPVEDFYSFLYDDYFVWKYTAKHRLASTRKSLKKYENDMNELSEIQDGLFSFDLSKTRLGLQAAGEIYGLGVAGASGLLALLFPSYFGTVDEMVVRALLTCDEYRDDAIIKAINPQDIKRKDAVYLIEQFKKKAHELNALSNEYCWRPRDIDVILWHFRDKDL
ncbi:hypothetical protein ACWOEJ_07780 [Enterococcus eurekensis]|uniref:Uncharacterized protein n=1 Tax=Enterococcus eurekensis TaxID=1159753 RepID=A0ABV9M4P4_9ENTE